MNDRQNLPSASGISRLASCPGSLRLCRDLPETTSADSDFGNHIHEFLAGTRKAEDLTPEELDIAESCVAIEEKVVKQWRLRCEIPDDANISTYRDNQRMWLEIDGEKKCSGLADVVHVWDRRALVIDFKTLVGDHGDATDNLQLRCLAILAQQHVGWLRCADVAIIQPLVTHSPTVCHYGVDDLIAAQKELLQILAAANNPNAPLVPGDQCKLCRANAVCPAVHQEVTELSLMTLRNAELMIGDEEMAELLSRTGPAMKMCASIRAEAFRRAEADPAAWRSYGYEIREGAGKRTVTDVATAAERMNAKGVDYKDITAACSISIKAVKTLVRGATNAKGMALEAAVDELLEGCCAVKKARPSLKKIGAALEEGEEE